jgi:hypothetical protein
MQNLHIAISQYDEIENLVNSKNFEYLLKPSLLKFKKDSLSIIFTDFYQDEE